MGPMARQRTYWGKLFILPVLQVTDRPEIDIDMVGT